MPEKYSSAQILHELPRPVMNFIWFLWDSYCTPDESEFYVALESDGECQEQTFILPSVGITIVQNFHCHINGVIVIRRQGLRCVMEFE